MPRDDFPSDVKDVLARRVGVRCSNPNCRQPTSGPQQDGAKAINLGVAAHITAAAKGGPRFDSKLNSSERRSIENAIWLCQNCAKLVDNDPRSYPPDHLRHWKRLSEEAARLEIDSPGRTMESGPLDQDLLRFYAQALDRPAFQDPFMQEGSMEAFDRAIEDTITAVNTGCLRSRDGAVLSQSKGKAFLKNVRWREQMDVIVDLLRAIRSRYDLGIRLNQLEISPRDNGANWYCIRDSSLAEWMDVTRGQVLGLFSEVAQEAGIPALRVRLTRPHRW